MQFGKNFPLIVAIVVFVSSAISLEEATAHYISTLYQKKRYSEVSSEVRNYLGRFPLSKQFSRVAILGGEAAYKEKNYYLGRYFFEQAFKKASGNAELRQSLLGIAKCSYKLGAYEEAAKFFETYVREFDDPVVNPAALYYAYICALASGKQEDAQRYGQWLATRYPDSSYLNLLSVPVSLPEKSASTQTSQNVSPQASAKLPPSSLNEVPFAVPQLVQRETTNIVVLTNWVTLSHQPSVTSQISQQPFSSNERVNTSLVSLEENERFLSLLEVKARLLQLKNRTLDDELIALGIGGKE